MIIHWPYAMANYENVEGKRSLRVEAQRVSGCGYGEPTKSYGCIGVARGSGSRGGRASVLCAVVVLTKQRAIIKVSREINRQKQDTNNKNGLVSVCVQCVN